MPVTPQYEWDETRSQVNVRVTLSGLTKQKPDVFATDALVKVVAHPYLLILDLAADVVSEWSSAVVNNCVITFTLCKAEQGYWGRLTTDDDKASVLRRRNDSIDKAHTRLEQERANKVQRRADEARAATDRQIDIDRRKRQEIETRKQQELSTERADLVEWQARLAIENVDESEEEDDDVDIKGKLMAIPEEKPILDHPDYYGVGHKAQPAPDTADGSSGKVRAPALSAGGTGNEPGNSESSSKTLAGTDVCELQTEASESDAGDGSDSDSDCDEASSHAVPLLPPPRINMEPVKVEFTALEFAHLPARANREDEIKVWKRSQRDAAEMADSLDITDRQPVFLKDKGDALFKQSNYYAAINAYTSAIGIDDDSPLAINCRSNRAACRFKLAEYALCIMDCDHVVGVLEQAKKAVDEQRHPDPVAWSKQYAKILFRRSLALANTDEVDQALAGLREALRHDRDNAQIQHNLDELEASLGPSDAARVKARADARFRAGRYAAAADAFSALLGWPGAAPEDRVAALGNRALCRMKLGQLEASIRDCDDAVDLLLRVPGDSTSLERWLLVLAQTRDASAAAQSVSAEALTGVAAGNSTEDDCTAHLAAQIGSKEQQAASHTGGADSAPSEAPNAAPAAAQVGAASLDDGAGLTDCTAGAAHAAHAQEPGAIDAALECAKAAETVFESTCCSSADVCAEAPSSAEAAAVQAHSARLMKMLTRKAASLAHLRKYVRAAAVYGQARDVAHGLGSAADAAALDADIAKMRELIAGGPVGEGREMHAGDAGIAAASGSALGRSCGGSVAADMSSKFSALGQGSEASGSEDFSDMTMQAATGLCPASELSVGDSGGAAGSVHGYAAASKEAGPGSQLSIPLGLGGCISKLVASGDAPSDANMLDARLHDMD